MHQKAGPAESAPIARMVPRLGDAVRLMRPRQWVKNAFVLSAVLFGGQLFHLSDLPVILATLVAFCLLSSAVYVFNDTVDRHTDALHPQKRHRPVASGRISPGQAYAFCVLLVAVSLGLCFYVSIVELGVGAAYLVLNIAYSFYLKKLFLLDIFSIAVGFIIRAFAGAVAVTIGVSPWFLLLIFLLSLILGLGKRRGELRSMGDQAKDHKASLGTYTTTLIDQFLPILVASIITSYAVYGYFAQVGHHRLIFTTPFVVYGLFRYLLLISGPEAAENPDELLVKDLPTLVNVAVWACAAIAILYV